MWIFISLIVFFIIVKFLYDRNSMLDKIDSNGGILIKYSTLISYMLSHPNSEISSKGKDHVNIFCKGMGVSTLFSITPGFDVVIIKWETNLGNSGSFNHSWQFKETTVSQQEMINQINKDIEFKTSILIQPESESFLTPLDIKETNVISGEGIRIKYNQLILRLTNDLDPTFLEFTDHLIVNIKSGGAAGQYLFLSDFNALIIKFEMNCFPLGIYKNEWKFSLVNYNQDLMAETIETYIKSIYQKISELAKGTDDQYSKNYIDSKSQNEIINDNAEIFNNQDFIKNLVGLPLKNKIQVAIEIYNTCDAEDKAQSFNLWYQCKSNNLVSDRVKEFFLKLKFFDPPLFPDKTDNYAIILRATSEQRGYEVLSTAFISIINSISGQYEVDRLLFILCAVSKRFNLISNELMESSKTAWSNQSFLPGMPYFLLLKLTQVDILIFKDKVEQAYEIAEETFTALMDPKYEDKYLWLKYQFASSLLTTLNYSGVLEDKSIWAVDGLNKLKDEFGENADLEDMLNEQQFGE